MSEPDDYDCDDGPAVLCRCDVCIDQLVVIGTELLGALTSPVDAALEAFADAASKLTRRLKWGARHLLEAVGATTTALGPMPAIPPPDTSPTLPAPVATGADDVTCPPPDTLSVPHDFDQPHLLILADKEQRWHQRLRAWYNGAMDNILLAESFAHVVTARETAFPPAGPTPFQATGVIDDIG